MLKALKNLINELKDIDKNNIDVTQFSDKIAMQTDWGPLNTYSSNFNTHRLVMLSGNVLKYKTTLGIKFFCGVFMAVGIGFLFFVGPRQHNRWLPESFLDEGLVQLICLLFFAAGASLLYFISSPTVFDGNKRLFFKGRGGKKKSIMFADIYALQLLPRYVSGSDGPDYWNYQLNIVFFSGNRLNIANYNHVENARNDANVIANFVAKKVWDASRQQGLPESYDDAG